MILLHHFLTINLGNLLVLASAIALVVIVLRHDKRWHQ